jgi:hypothetical protein
VDLLQFLLQRVIHHAVTLDQHLTVEARTDDRHLEVRLGPGRDIMHVAFIFDPQEFDFEFLREFPLNGALHGHVDISR